MTSTQASPFECMGRISPLTLQEFNQLLEESKPYSKAQFKDVNRDPVSPVKHTFLQHLEGLQVLYCTKCQTYVPPKEAEILRHLRVRGPMPLRSC